MNHPWLRRALVAAAVALGAAGPSARGQVRIPQLPVYIEDSQAAEDAFQHAQALRQQKRATDAATAYQELVQQFGGKLLPVAENLFVDARRRVFGEILGDAEVLNAYRKLYEPEAARALRLAGNDPAKLEVIVASYLPTQAGLEAGLRLAAICLERAHPVDAASVLDQLGVHPDLVADPSRWELLRAAAALYSGDEEGLKRHREALQKRDARDALAKLDAWTEKAALPSGPPRFDAAAQLPAVPLPEALPAALWQHEMPDPLGKEGGRELLLRMRGQGNDVPVVFNVLPLVIDNRLYLNAGDALQVLDRFSGRVIWSYDHPNDPNAGFGMNPYMRVNGITPDQRGVAVESGRVVGVVGYAAPGAMNWGARSNSDVSLACVSDADGRLLWRVETKDIDPGLGSAFFHGTPIQQDGRVFALVRRSQMSGFQDEYLVALDVATGKPLWRRYLSSAVVGNRSSGRPMAQMTLASGRLFVADYLGAVACVRARDGVALWTNKLPDKLDALDVQLNRGRANPLPWQSGSPVLVEAGLIVPPFDGGAAARLLDPQTGRVIRELPGSAWADADYLANAGPHVLSVGSTLYLLDGKKLDLRWTYDPDSGDRLAGRAAITPDHVLVPLNDRLEVVRLSDGQRVASHPLTLSGGLLPLPDQLLVTDGTFVRSHMSWTVAYAILQERVRAGKVDPMPGLALAHLALNANQSAAVLEGADAALEAMRQQRAALAGDPAAATRPANEASQNQVFRQLLDFATRPGVADAALRRALFDRVPAASDSPEEEVAYRFAFGAFLAQNGQVIEAVDHYQAVLMDPTLAAQLYQRGVTSRQAGLEARIRLTELVASAGPAVYEKYDTAATQRFAELSAGPADPAALLELARQYPLARAAPAALLAAGEQLMAAGDADAALQHFRRAAQADGADLTVKARAAGAVAQAYLATERPRQARSWLETLRRTSPSLQPIRDGQPVSVDLWLGEISKETMADARLPQLEPPLGTPSTLDGRLIVPTAQNPNTWPTDAVLISQGGALRLMRSESGAAFNEAWSMPLDRTNPVVIWFDKEQVVLWDDEAAAIRALDARTGKPAWDAVDAKTRLAEVGDENRRREAVNEDEKVFLDALNPAGINMRQFRRMQRIRRGELRDEPGYFVKVSEGVVCLGDRSGRLMGFDRRSGKVLWRYLSPLEDLTHFELSAEALIVSGLVAGQPDSTGGAVMVLDPVTGEPRLPLMEDKLPIRWVGMGREDLVVRVTDAEAVAHHLGDGTLAWRLALMAPGSAAPAGVAGGELLFLQNNEGGAQVIDTASGQVVNRLTLSPRTRIVRFEARPAGQHFHLLVPGGATAIGADGKVAWRDAGVSASGSGELYLAQLVGERHLVLLSLVSSPELRRMRRLGLGPNGRVLVQRGGAVLRIGGDARVQIRGEDVMVEVDPQPVPDAADVVGGAAEGWVYKLYAFDRLTGVMTDERTLGPLPDAIDTARATVLDGKLLLPTPNAVVVVPGAAK